jgi:hypothetical protein
MSDFRISDFAISEQTLKSVIADCSADAEPTPEETWAVGKQLYQQIKAARAAIVAANDKRFPLHMFDFILNAARELN